MLVRSFMLAHEYGTLAYLNDSSPQQTLPSAERVRDENDKDGASNHLDDAVYTSRKEPGRRARQPNTSENST